MAQYPTALAKYITKKVTLEEAQLHCKIGSGLFRGINSNEENYTLYFELPLDKDNHCIDDINASKCLALVSEYGGFWFYDFEHFINGMSGIITDNDQELSESTISLILHQLPEAVRSLFGWLAPSKHKKVSEQALALTCRIQAIDCTLYTQVWAEPQSWAALFANNGWQHCTQTIWKTSNFIITEPCIVGELNLTLSRWVSLDAGDVLLLERNYFDVNGEGDVNLFGKSLRLIYLNSGSKLQLLVKQCGKVMNLEEKECVKYIKHEKNSNNNTVKHSIVSKAIPDTESSQSKENDLLINLKVQLGEVSINLSQIDKLASGVILTLNTPCPDKVQLMSGNQEVGRGLLVDIEGKLGVEIVRHWGNEK